MTGGTPKDIRSDNGPEFTARRVRNWLDQLGVRTLFIEPESPWDNGFTESFNGKLREDWLKVELFDTLPEARVLTDRCRRHYNAVRPHSSLEYRPPAPDAVLSAINFRPDLTQAQEPAPSAGAGHDWERTFHCSQIRYYLTQPGRHLVSALSFA